MAATGSIRKSINKKDFLISLLCLTLFYLIQIYSHWWTLAITGIRGAYTLLDLKLVLKSFDCYQIVGDRVFEPSTGDPCTGYIYGRNFLFLMTKMGVGENFATILGLLLISLFLVIAAAVIAFSSSERHSAVLGLLVFTSPSCWLLLERANLDILMFILVVVGLVLLWYKRPILAALIFAVSALIKFYTLPLIFLVLPFYSKLRSKLIHAGFSLALMFIVMSEIRSIPKFPGTWYVSYGNQVVGHWWNLLVKIRNLDLPTVSMTISSVVGIISVSIAVSVAHRFKRREFFELGEILSSEIRSRSLVVYTYFFSTVVFLLCYFAGMNYDYRLFYIGIASVCAYKVFGLGNWPVRVLLFCSIPSLWLSCFFYNLKGTPVAILQLVGDVLVGICASVSLLILVNLALILFKERNARSF